MERCFLPESCSFKRRNSFTSPDLQKRTLRTKCKEPPCLKVAKDTFFFPLFLSPDWPRAPPTDHLFPPFGREKHGAPASSSPMKRGPPPPLLGEAQRPGKFPPIFNSVRWRK